MVHRRYRAEHHQPDCIRYSRRLGLSGQHNRPLAECGHNAAVVRDVAWRDCRACPDRYAGRLQFHCRHLGTDDLWSVDQNVGTLISGGNAQDIVELPLPNGNTAKSVRSCGRDATGNAVGKAAIADRTMAGHFDEIETQLPITVCIFWHRHALLIRFALQTLILGNHFGLAGSRAWPCASNRYRNG